MKYLIALIVTLLSSVCSAQSLASSTDAFFKGVNDFVAALFFFNITFFIPGVNIPLVLVWLLTGAIYLTFKMRFINVRGFKHAIDLTLGRHDTHESKGEVSHFQALTAALSGTLGLGNISGVAIAISMGGPGATFWIIIAGFLGMSSKFAECTLAQIYREKRVNGQVLGGPMLYLENGFAKRGYRRFGKFLAVVFSILCIFGAYGGGGSFQVNQSLYALGEVMPFWLEYKWLYGLLMATLVGVVTIGGIKRIASVAVKVVPLMCVTYVGMALYILAVNYALIPAALGKIIVEAFSPDAVYGGILGTMVVGFRRAAFSNEAGMGSAAIAHSAAKTTNPVEEGVVSLLEPFLDTVVICTMTALVLVITGAYNDPAHIDLIHNQNGAALTSRAFGQVNSWFPLARCFVVFLFAFATIISWSYYGERCFTYLFGEKYSIIYKSLLVVVLFLGAVASSTNMMDFGDLMILGMGFPNLIGVFVMRNEIRDKMDEYWLALKAKSNKA